MQIKFLSDVIVVQKGQHMNFNDGMKNDFILVKSGEIQITLRLDRPQMFKMDSKVSQVDDDELFGAQSEYPYEKTITLGPDQYFDYQKRISESSGLQHYEVSHITGKEKKSKIMRLRYNDFIKFTTNNCIR